MWQHVVFSAFFMLHLSSGVSSSLLSGCSETELISGTKHSVVDTYLTASTSYGCKESEGTPRSRLNTKEEEGKAGAWCAGKPTSDQWIQVDLRQHMLIKSVATQGRNYRAAEWVRTYRLQYDDGHGWKTYTTNGLNVTFTGNSNQDTIRKNTLASPIHARYIRLVPVTWYGWICLRWELYGCDLDCERIPLLSGTTYNNMTYKLEDCQLTASTSYASWGSRAARSRLNTKDKSGKAGGWCPATANTVQWIQVDFNKPVVVTAIATQGRYYSTNSYYHRVMSAYVLFSEEGYSWRTYREGTSYRLFGSSTVTNTVVNQTLANPFMARYVRLNPRTWRTFPCLRWEIYGCLLF